MPYQQPQSGPGEIDRSSPFGARLVSAYMPSLHCDPASSYGALTGPNVTFPATSKGVVLTSPSIGGGVKIASGGFDSLIPLTGSADEYTIFARVLVTQQSHREFIFADFDSSGSTASIGLEKNSSNQWSVFVRSGASTQSITGGTSSNGWHDIIITVSGGRFRAYWNGREEDNKPISIPSIAGVDLRIGRTGAYPDLSWTGGLLFCLFFNKGYLPADLTPVIASPWQLFADEDEEELFASSGAASPIGALSATLAGVAMVGAGAAMNTGALATSLDGTTMSASGSVGAAPSGALVSTLAGCAMVAAGQIIVPGAFATSLAGVTMTSAGTVDNRGTMAATLGGVSMSAAGTVAPNATGTFSSTLDGATMTAYGYNGVPPVLAGFFQRLPKNPRHVQHLP